MRRQNAINPIAQTSSVGIVAMETSQDASTLGAVPFAHASNLGESLDIRWYRHKLKQKVCNRLAVVDAQAAVAADPVCACGYKRSEHTERAVRNGDRNKIPPEHWSPEMDTHLQATHAFGEMEFVGYGQKISKFARVANDTPMNVLLDLLMKQWSLEKPNLLISVTGGAKNFTMKPKLKQVFNQGLMKAARSTSAWIVTGGMHAGVMKHVGEAVRTSELSGGSKNKVTVIGVAPWGCVANRQVLTGSGGKWPAAYVMDATTKQGESPLDMNHSHFILVDNGTQYKFATEIALRAQLEAAIGDLKSGFDVVSVPRVCVLLEGGPGSLETVKSAIENGTPAVIVDGSGRSADVIAYAFHHATEVEEEIEDHGRVCRHTRLVLGKEVREEVRRMLTSIFGSSASMNTWLSWVDQCIKNRDMLTIFSLNSPVNVNNDIDLSLLTALLKAQKNRLQDQLKLALAWNRIDIAKNQIFSKDRQWKQSELSELMMAALKLGRDDFVQLFLENGINMKLFLSTERLMELYNQIPKNCALYHLLHRADKERRTTFDLRDVGLLIKELMGDFYDPMYLQPKYVQKNGDVGFALHKMGLENLGYEEEEGDENLWDDGMADFLDPSRELFLWAVLMNHKSMATLLWVDAKDPMAGALTGSKLMKGMAARTREADQRKNILETAEEFQGLALAVLHECYVADAEQAELLLIREQPNFGKATCLELAVHGHNEDFVAHPCVQMLLNKIWKGKISPDYHWIRFVVCVICPLLIFPLLYYREDEAQNIKKREKAKQNKKVPPIGARGTTRSRSDMENHQSDESQYVEETREQHQNKHSVECQTYKERPKLSQPLDFYDLGRHLTFLERFVYFYRAPLVVFTMNCISYLIFLSLFSYNLLVEYSPRGITSVETVLVIWVGTLICEEIRQMMAETGTLKTALKIYFNSILNWVDVLTLTLFFLALGMRFYPVTFDAPRYILCICLTLFFVRLLHIFSVFKQLGPMLIMIKHMIIDLFWFMLIIAVFLVAYGVIRQAILHPNSAFNGLMIYSLLRAAYWQMQGEIEMFLGETEADGCGLMNGTLDGCSTPQLIVPPIMALYILFTNILMFNLLIAMFSFTFTAIQENSERVWSFQRYSLVQEYYERPPIPPPFIILFHIFLLSRWFLSFYNPKYSRPWKGDCRIVFCSNEEKIREKQLVLWENMNADEYARKRSLIELQTPEYKIQDTRNKLEQLHAKFDSLQEQLQQIPLRGVVIEGMAPPSPASVATPRELERKIQVLEEKVNKTNESLEWIIRRMRRQRSATPRTRRDRDGQNGGSGGTSHSPNRSVTPQAQARWPDLFGVTGDSLATDER